MEKFGKGGEKLRYNMILKYSYVLMEKKDDADGDAMKVIKKELSSY